MTRCLMRRKSTGLCAKINLHLISATWGMSFLFVNGRQGHSDGDPVVPKSDTADNLLQLYFSFLVIFSGEYQLHKLELPPRSRPHMQYKKRVTVPELKDPRPDPLL